MSGDLYHCIMIHVVCTLIIFFENVCTMMLVFIRPVSCNTSAGAICEFERGRSGEPPSEASACGAIS